jgi:hypothetical protein
MVPSVPDGPLSQSINWTENRPAGHPWLHQEFHTRITVLQRVSKGITQKIMARLFWHRIGNT